MKSRLCTIALVLLFVPSSAMAYRPWFPGRHDVFSPNRRFVADINPATEVNTVYSGNDRRIPLWSVKRSSGLAPIFLDDKGKTLAFLSWQHVNLHNFHEEATCLEFWNENGHLKSYTFAKICPKPRPRDPAIIGPVGEFWAIWYHDAQLVGDLLRVKPPTGRPQFFSMLDGEVADAPAPEAPNPVNFIWPEAPNPVNFIWIVGLGLFLITVAAFVRFKIIRRQSAGGSTKGNHDRVIDEPFIAQQ